MIIIRPVEITDAVLTATDVTETEETEFTLGATFAVDDLVQVTTTGVHAIFISLQAGNTGNQPEDDDLVNPVFWARVRATNRWAMFRDQLNDQTEQATSLEVELTPGALVNAISFFNLDVVEIHIVMTSVSGGGTVYDRTFNLVDDSGVNDWYAWYFEPIVKQRTLAVLDLPPHLDGIMTITFTSTGGTPKVGRVSIGSQRKLGDTDFGTGIGIINYSRKERDTFGEPVIVKRNFTKRSDYNVTVDSGFVDTIQDTLSDFRDIPLTWIGSVNFPSTIIYGFYNDFDVILSNPTKSLLNISVEGLT